MILKLGGSLLVTHYTTGCLSQRPPIIARLQKGPYLHSPWAQQFGSFANLPQVSSPSTGAECAFPDHESVPVVPPSSIGLSYASSSRSSIGTISRAVTASSALSSPATTIASFHQLVSGITSRSAQASHAQNLHIRMRANRLNSQSH